MKVRVKVSARHVHLNQKDFYYLFPDKQLEIDFDLSQKGQFASTLYVDLEANGEKIEHVRILGPIREYTQVEISCTDAYKLKLNPPVRDSGALNNAAIITICNEERKITRDCCIIANRHIHIDQKTRHELGLEEINKVKLMVPGIKGGILDNVFIKERDDFVYEAHLDVDDANSHLIKNNSELEIILD